ADYGGMLRLLPPEHWPQAGENPEPLMARLLKLASRMRPQQLASSKRKPKRAESAKGKGYVDGCQVRAHVSTARVLKQARGKDLERHGSQNDRRLMRLNIGASASADSACTLK
ncbi:MAG: hypothetical protein Q4B94_07175, partial [Pseudomonadota bacterium]|nr:hypothetical protein [Pseudomonadota bacterium]